MSEALLEVEKLSAGYGDARVLDDVSFRLDQGGSLALLGRNGMGKTTLLTSLIGLTRRHGGRIRLAGRDLTAVPTHRRALAGLGWVPQERDIFPSLTVEENLTAIATGGAWTLDRVYDLFPRLMERRSNMGNQLSGGEQQMLAIARALMLDPKVLLLDEPMEGLAPLIVQELFRIIQRMIERDGLAVILVEQHAHQILPLTRDAMILERGRVVYSGDSRRLIDEPALLDRWLGVGAVELDDGTSA
ncbi:ABC transporter ATP-binding protein [Azospirillum sp. RWY-5-1]|uniref:ABC transporter ATP-binding protein n=1 Tax=Azospirillum oleiclasticum TaxID=2735135 RepID=A0ABX2T9N2_9PROT|nr:ABC transporter ATP-binding protein [Azospirillum oleiclasticum]NYZ13681.1 ABC transporter ATP-binding protein [Azospirillum oleiclasticum]NYZ20953.1 ABC transporter ATP-binding protein [Azospirillum oleiclasticum]